VICEDGTEVLKMAECWVQVPRRKTFNKHWDFNYYSGEGLKELSTDMYLRIGENKSWQDSSRVWRHLACSRNDVGRSYGITTNKAKGCWPAFNGLQSPTVWLRALRSS